MATYDRNPERGKFKLIEQFQNGPFPFILPIMRLLHMKAARQWDNADDEIAGVSKSTPRHLVQ